LGLIATFRPRFPTCIVRAKLLYSRRLSRLPEGTTMRAFIVACITAAVIAVVAALALNAMQEPVESAFATSSVRI